MAFEKTASASTRTRPINIQSLPDTSSLAIFGHNSRFNGEVSLNKDCPLYLVPLRAMVVDGRGNRRQRLCLTPPSWPGEPAFPLTGTSGY